MGTAIIGLIGGLLGATVALVGSVISVRLQARLERTKWQQDRRKEAYDGALRYLLRAANRRSEITVSGGGKLSSVMAQEHIREWFDDLVEAQFWLRTLTTCCSDEQLQRLREAADALDDAVITLVGGRVEPADEGRLVRVGARQRGFDSRTLQTAIQTVTECARADGQALANQR